MTDHQTVVRSYDDVESHVEVKGSEPDAIARELSEIGECADAEVLLVEEWLLDQKEIESIPTHYRVVTGTVERETGKALLIRQGIAEDWIPKSCSESFVLAPGAEIEIPQTGLDAFAGQAAQEVSR